MNYNFQNIDFHHYANVLSEPVVATALAIIAVIGLFLGLVFAFGLYIYFALAMQGIAKKMGYAKSWLAWIPVANMFLFPILTGRKWTWGLLFFIPVVHVVLLMICLWEIMEKLGYNGKWSLLLLGNFLPVPMQGISSASFMIILGILAWKKK